MPSLDRCDSDCPNQHFSKIHTNEHPDAERSTSCCVEFKDHHLVCFSDDSCHSRLWILKVRGLHPVAKVLVTRVQITQESQLHFQRRQSTVFL